MWIVEISVVGLSCWAGPIICTAVAYDEYNLSDQVEHTEKMSVRQIDRTDAFRANILLRANAVKGLQKLLEKRANVKYVITYGYVSFPCPWPTKTVMVEPEIAYRLAMDKHDKIMAEYDRRFPEWGFSRHKGEGTHEHRKMILSKRQGTPVHRRSFMPMARFYSIEAKKSGTGFVATKKKR